MKWNDNTFSFWTSTSPPHSAFWLATNVISHWPASLCAYVIYPGHCINVMQQHSATRISKSNIITILKTVKPYFTCYWESNTITITGYCPTSHGSYDLYSIYLNTSSPDHMIWNIWNIQSCCWWCHFSELASSLMDTVASVTSPKREGWEIECCSLYSNQMPLNPLIYTMYL